jgi:N4-gp56 family major capsid protein
MAVAAPAVTTDTEERKNVKQYWDRALLDRAHPELVHTEFGNKDGVPKGFDASNPGTVEAYEWMRPERIAVNQVYDTQTPNTVQRPEALYSATTLANHNAGLGGYGVPQGADPTSSDASPVAKKIAITLITATPQEYGAYYIGSARLARSGLHSFREMVTDILGQNMGEVVDLITRNQLYGSGFPVIYAGAATTDATVTAAMTLGFQELVEAVAALKTAVAPYHRNGHYVAIIGPMTWGTIMLDDKFQQTVIFGQKNTMFEGKLDKGSVPWVGVEFYETPFSFSTANATAVQVHSTFVFGKDAYGVLGLDGLGSQNIFHDVGSAGSQDPLNQRWTQGWKCSHVAKVLDTTRGVEIRHAVKI